MPANPPKPPRRKTRLRPKKLDHGTGARYARARAPKTRARPTLCTLVDDAFAERVRARCEAEGITVSTLVHQLVTEWLDGTRPSADEVYTRAFKLAIATIVNSTPKTYAEALTAWKNSL